MQTFCNIFRSAGKTALSLHAKTTGTCKKIKIDKLAKADMKIKMLLNNENILATGKDLDGNSPFQTIEGTVTSEADSEAYLDEPLRPKVPDSEGDDEGEDDKATKAELYLLLITFFAILGLTHCTMS